MELVDRLPKCGGDRARGAEEKAGRLLRQSVELPALGRRRSFQFEVEKQKVVNPTPGRAAGCSERQSPGWGRLAALPTQDVHQSDISLESIRHGGYFTNLGSARQSCCKFQTWEAEPD